MSRIDNGGNIYVVIAFKACKKTDKTATKDKLNKNMHIRI